MENEIVIFPEISTELQRLSNPQFSEEHHGFRLLHTQLHPIPVCAGVSQVNEAIRTARGPARHDPGLEPNTLWEYGLSHYLFKDQKQDLTLTSYSQKLWINRVNPRSIIYVLYVCVFLLFVCSGGM